MKTVDHAHSADAGRFEESKHPRANNGQFGAGSGKSHAEHAQHHWKKADDHVKAAMAVGNNTPAGQAHRFAARQHLQAQSQHHTGSTVKLPQGHKWGGATEANAASLAAHQASRAATQAAGVTWQQTSSGRHTAKTAEGRFEIWTDPHEGVLLKIPSGHVESYGSVEEAKAAVETSGNDLRESHEETKRLAERHESLADEHDQAAQRHSEDDDADTASHHRAAQNLHERAAAHYEMAAKHFAAGHDTQGELSREYAEHHANEAEDIEGRHRMKNRLKSAGDAAFEESKHPRGSHGYFAEKASAHGSKAAAAAASGNAEAAKHHKLAQEEYGQAAHAIKGRDIHHFTRQGETIVVGPKAVASSNAAGIATALSNSMFNSRSSQAGREAMETGLRDPLQKAYASSGGDKDKVLAALKGATNLPDWSHTKTVPAKIDTDAAHAHAYRASEHAEAAREAEEAHARANPRAGGEAKSIGALATNPTGAGLPAGEKRELATLGRKVSMGEASKTEARRYKDLLHKSKNKTASSTANDPNAPMTATELIAHAKSIGIKGKLVKTFPGGDTLHEYDIPGRGVTRIRKPSGGTADATFEEGKHPRDHGKFSSKPGAGASHEDYDQHHMQQAEAHIAEAGKHFKTNPELAKHHLEASQKHIDAGGMHRQLHAQRGTEANAGQVDRAKAASKEAHEHTGKALVAEGHAHVASAKEGLAGMRKAMSEREERIAEKSKDHAEYAERHEKAAQDHKDAADEHQTIANHRGENPGGLHRQAAAAHTRAATLHDKAAKARRNAVEHPNAYENHVNARNATDKAAGASGIAEHHSGAANASGGQHDKPSLEGKIAQANELHRHHSAEEQRHADAADNSIKNPAGHARAANSHGAARAKASTAIDRYLDGDEAGGDEAMKHARQHAAEAEKHATPDREKPTGKHRIDKA